MFEVFRSFRLRDWLALAVAALALWWLTTPSHITSAVERLSVSSNKTAPTPAAPHRWRYVVLHHSGNATDTIARVRDWHVNRLGWRDIGYHFIVTQDGGLYAGERWRQQWDGAHCKGARNKDGIGVCLLGDFANAEPTDTQRRAAASLVQYLCESFDIPAQNVIRHSDAAATACPGGLTWSHVPAD